MIGCSGPTPVQNKVLERGVLDSIGAIGKQRANTRNGQPITS
jgi:hypothetical protein